MVKKIQWFSMDASLTCWQRWLASKEPKKKAQQGIFHMSLYYLYYTHIALIDTLPYHNQHDCFFWFTRTPITKLTSEPYYHIKLYEWHNAHHTLKPSAARHCLWGTSTVPGGGLDSWHQIWMLNQDSVNVGWCSYGGFHGHGGYPIAGWLIL